MKAASIVVTALYPKDCEATHCRRFYSAIAWREAEMIASMHSVLRSHTPRHRADHMPRHRKEVDTA